MLKLESQVCSLELAKKLKELGVPQESLWRWVIDPKSSKYYLTRSQSFQNGYSAFTVAELGQILKYNYKYFMEPVIEGDMDFDIVHEFHCNLQIETEANARAKMLIHLIEQGIVNPKGGEG